MTPRTAPLTPRTPPVGEAPVTSRLLQAALCRVAQEASAALRLPADAAEGVAAAGKGAVEAEALQEFADFWEAGTPRTPQRDPAACPEGTDEFCISTPKKLQVFYVGTPRGAAPETPPKEEQRYVPDWPYWGSGVAPTTLELRGLPQGCYNEVIIAQLNEWGFAGRFDFVHVPLDYNGQCGGGARINTVRHADGLAIAGRLHGFTEWKSCGACRPCRVGWCLQLQGLDTLLLEHQQRPDGSAVGPYFLLGNQWACLPQPYYYQTACAW
mmetsp:Transcript_40239/g.125398  ORF Transcript_40239/g.125398 Transcript_40239/m.125398 type:complete len:268 (+) Transcript_40239:354-1157(+)